MASAAEERAMALIMKAEKKLKGMFSFGNGKFEEAAEMYGQAAKQYQLAKKCKLPKPCNRDNHSNRAVAVDKAADCYLKQVEFHNKLGSALEMAMAYREAGVMWEKQENAQECCKCLLEAKDLYASEGRLSECAKLAKKRAEIFEKAEIMDFCVESYREAAELYDGEGQAG